jgi:hypothetical protein
MIGRLTRQFVVAAACAAAIACGDDTTDPPTSPTPGTSRLAITPQTDFLTIGTAIVLDARLTEGTSPPRSVPADWSSSDGRVVGVDRTGRITANGAGSATIRAVFGADSTSMAVRVAPDFAGTWSGQRRVAACVHPRPDFCAATYPNNRQAATTLVLTQARDRVTGTLSLNPPLASPSSAVTGAIADLGRLTLDGAIISTPATGASVTLGTLVDFRVDLEAVTNTMRGSFVESRTDADGTTWRVSWDILALTKTR